MRPIFRYLIIASVCACSLLAQIGQETVDHTYAAKVIPFPLLSYTPGACQAGQVFIRKDQSWGVNTYLCGNDNNWVPMFSSGTVFTNMLLNFPIQGTATDGETLAFDASQHAWLPVSVPVWKKYTFTYSQLSANAFSKAMNLLTLVARQKVCGISIYVTTAFAASPTLTKATVSVGDSLGTATTYTANTLSIAATNSNDYNVLGSIAPGTGIVQANFTVSGAILSDLTAGSVDIDLCTIQLP